LVAAATSTTLAVLEGLSDDVDDDVVIDVTEEVDDWLGEVVDVPPAPTVIVRVTVLAGKVTVVAGRVTVVGAPVGAAGGPQGIENRGHPPATPPPLGGMRFACTREPIARNIAALLIMLSSDQGRREGNYSQQAQCGTQRVGISRTVYKHCGASEPER